MQTKNGIGIKVVELDFWSRVVVSLNNDRFKKLKLVVVDSQLHTMCSDGEPISALKNEYQFDEPSFKSFAEKFSKISTSL